MSSRKNQLTRFLVVNNESMASNIVSSVSDIQILDNIGFHLLFTGAPTGNFQIEVSVDYAEDTLKNVTNPGEWVPVVLEYWNGAAITQDVSIPASVGSPIYIDLNFVSAPYIRCSYTATAGTGTLNAYITAKQI